VRRPKGLGEKAYGDVWVLGLLIPSALLQSPSIPAGQRVLRTPPTRSRTAAAVDASGAWARLISNPEDREKAAESYIESVDGKPHGFWYAFGTHDGSNLREAPDNVSMAAVALAISGGGALSSLETTVLLNVEETMDALRKAGQVQYRAPGS